MNARCKDLRNPRVNCGAVNRRAAPTVFSGVLLLLGAMLSVLALALSTAAIATANQGPTGGSGESGAQIVNLGPAPVNIEGVLVSGKDGSTYELSLFEY